MKITKLEVIEEKVDGNPVGVIHWLDEIEAKVEELYLSWKEMYPDMPWYKSWQTWSKPSLYAVTTFLIDSLDELIDLVDDLIIEGPDKKATVLAAINALYEHVGREAVPVLLRPFARAIKNYIVYTLIAASIDWIVNKYRNGEWRQKAEDLDGANNESDGS